MTRGWPCGHNDPMAKQTVGIRELKTRLGTYLRRVSQGATLIVTDRGEPVAELKPIEDHGDRALQRLRTLGLLTRQSQEVLRPFKPMRVKGASLSQAVIEDREDRF